MTPMINYLFIIRILGFILVAIPLASYIGISVWMISEITKEEPNIKYFISTMTIIAAVGLILLGVGYLYPMFMSPRLG